MTPQQVEIVHSLFRMAWADGDASDEEVEVLSRLMTRLGLPLAERVAVMDQGLSEEPAPQDKLEEVLPDRASRLQAMEMLVILCFADKNLAPEEIGYLQQLALKLGVTAAELEQLRQKALQELS